MRKVLIVFSALLVLTLGASLVNAGGPIPNIQVYFTSDWGAYGKTQIPECPPDPPGTVIDSLYIVANNFNMWMIGVEYQVIYPAPHIMWLADNTGDGLNIGSSPTGIATTWPIPQNAYVPYAVNKVLFIYMCQLCYEGTNVPIDVVPHPDTGFVRAVSWPGITYTYGIGMRSLICPTIPVEETTWGTIKALYQD